MAWWVALLGLCTGCLIASPVMTFGEGKTAKQAQRDTMSDFTPIRLTTDEKWAGKVETRKVRVWADTQYRSQNVRWQQSFEGPIEFANLVLTPRFGIALVPEYRAWDRQVPGSSLTDDLEALAKLDPGDDVFAVIGLTSSLPLVSATFEDLGLAELGGRHVMMRGYADLEERKVYADAFRDLLPEERELSLAQRRDHKTAVVLVHELAHNLGVEHDAEEDTIMSASYSHRASTFTSRARAVMARTIDERLGRGAARAAAPATTPATMVLPAASSSAEPARRGPLIFHVNVSGEVLLDDAVVDSVAIDDVLADAFARDPGTEIIIKRARKAPALWIEHIVGRATAIGLKRVSLTLY